MRARIAGRPGRESTTCSNRSSRWRIRREGVHHEHTRSIVCPEASKHGVIGLTKTAALECATKGIRVNAVCPGVIHTEMIDRVTGKDPAIEQQFVNMEPMGRMGTPQEIAEAAVWLCSPAASFITGQALAIDGGLVAR
jgi:NAD(P)-dependent dehydrogenase (short-subunit alcohol dehydrogenase family)